MVFLNKWILNIVTLSIFIILIEVLIPSGKVRKVVRFSYRFYTGNCTY